FRICAGVVRFGCRILGTPAAKRQLRLRCTTMFSRLRFAAALITPFLLGSIAAFAQTPAKVSFQKDVAPVLVEKCQGCHGGSMKMNDLSLDSREATLKGGKRGPALVP